MSGHGHDRHDRKSAAIAVLTVSDSRDPASDRSGPEIRDALEGAGHTVFDRRIVPDEPQAIGDCLGQWLAAAGCDGVIVTGGTGIAARDRTPETLAALYQRRLDGFGEAFRALSFEEIGARAMLSRASAGIVSGKPVFSLPGSPSAVRLGLSRLILPVLPHLLGQLSS